jgi:hypothetical protein
VEEPDLRELNGKMRKQDEFGAIPLFSCCGDLLLERQSAYASSVAKKNGG